VATPAEHRRDLAALVGIAETDLRLLFQQVGTAADDVRDALMDALPRLVAIYGAAAATLAADWYDDYRDERGAGGRFRAIPAALVADEGRFESLARWSVAPLYSATPDLDAAFGKVFGGTQRLIADAGRETVMGSLRQDPQGRGWSRHTDGSACDFCQGIAGRGAVYSATTADFSAHDDCGCVAVPEYGNEAREVKPYVPSQRFTSQAARDAHNARTRAWLAE
jgi:hypothetical protein